MLDIGSTIQVAILLAVCTALFWWLLSRTVLAVLKENREGAVMAYLFLSTIAVFFITTLSIILAVAAISGVYADLTSQIDQMLK